MSHGKLKIKENKRQINNHMWKRRSIYKKKRVNSYQKATTSFARIVNNILKHEEVDKKDDCEGDGKEPQDLSQKLLPATIEEALAKYPSDHHPCCPQPQYKKTIIFAMV